MRITSLAGFSSSALLPSPLRPRALHTRGWAGIAHAVRIAFIVGAGLGATGCYLSHATPADSGVTRWRPDATPSVSIDGSRLPRDAGPALCGAGQVCEVSDERMLLPADAPRASLLFAAQTTPSADVFVVTTADQTLLLVDVIAGQPMPAQTVGTGTVFDSAASGDRVALLWQSADGSSRLDIYDTAERRFVHRGESPTPIASVAATPTGFAVLTLPPAQVTEFDLSGERIARTALGLRGTSFYGPALRAQNGNLLFTWGAEDGCVHAHWMQADGTPIADHSVFCNETSCRLAPQQTGRPYEGGVPLSISVSCEGMAPTWEIGLVGGPDDPALLQPLPCSTWSPVVELDSAGLRVLSSRVDSGVVFTDSVLYSQIAS